MQKFNDGLIAGLAATIVLSILMIAKSMMGLMPNLDVIHMLAHMMGTPLVVGWLAHFLIGTVAWGGGFALAYAAIPGSNAVTKGLVFATGAWAAMMMIVMPIAGAGFFGSHLGPMAAIMTLLLHLVFGAVLGGTYQYRDTAHAPAH